MAIARLLLIITFLASSAIAQDTPQLSEEEALYQKLTQLATFAPNSDEFASTWSEYVVNYVKSEEYVDDAIKRVMDSAAEFRREFRNNRTPSSGPALSYFQMTELMQGIATEALAAVDD